MTLLTGFFLLDICVGFFFNEVAGFQAPTHVFSCDFCKIFKNFYFYRTHPVATSVVSFLVMITQSVNLEKLLLACKFIKKKTQVFSCKYYEIFKYTYLKEHLGMVVSITR